MEDSFKEGLHHYILPFLNEFKALMERGHYFVKCHHKNIQALINLGINSRLRDEIILSLTLKDYSSGPIKDEYKPGNLWVFGKNLESTEIYIKLKIVTDEQGNDQAVCYSFHPSEHPLRYPFRS